MKRSLPARTRGIGLNQHSLKVFISCVFLLLIACTGYAQEKNTITGTVSDEKGVTLIGVSVKVKNTAIGATTDANGKFVLNVPAKNVILQFVYVGFISQDVALNGRSSISVQLREGNENLQEVVVTGYGSQKRESITGSIASVTSKDIDRVHGGSTVSTALAGKIPGVTFRMADGRPGASANIQIRNMGSPLYVIDGIQQDVGQFNNLSPNDIESISVLKDASAAIYGVRAANGVVVVTTKKGNKGESIINVDAYLGYQNWTRFPKVLNNSYDYMLYKADAEINGNGSTSITAAELEKYRAGTERGYQSFDWRDYVLKSNNNAPQNNINVNFTGGSDKMTYYVSATNLYQNSVLGKEYEFKRSNIQSNITAQVANGLKVGLNINGRIESRENPGVPGGDDYFLARYSVLRNTPLERPYANDNPLYLNDIGHSESNYAFLNKRLSGVYRSDWRVIQANFNAEYQIPGVKGLTARAVYSYYYADYVLNNNEYTYNTYTYRPATDTYDITGGSNNPYREREQRKEFSTTQQAQLNYNNTFGKHNLTATLVAERLELIHQRNYVHGSPISNNLPLIYFPTLDTYNDTDDTERRIGYIGRVNYNYDSRYYLELSARRDASYLFDPAHRVGYFPSVSAGWRITEEKWMKNLLGDSKILTDLKFRASYGVLGDDRNPNDATQAIVAPYAYLPGYNYNQGTAILDGNAVIVSRDKGIPINRISWLKSKTTDVGADFSLFSGKLSGSADYFYRKRTGLLGIRTDIVVPTEIGYTLPQENVNSDAQYGQEIALNYAGKVGQVGFNVGGNISYTRQKNLNSYNPLFFNSWDQYRNSLENRYSHIDWGYEVIGQFNSQEQINNYTVNNDGKGNRSLIPGDLMYKDQNGDGKIDQYDERPLGFGLGTQPNINYGLNIGLSYKAFDFHADFSGGAGYTYSQNYEGRWAFQNGGNLNEIFLDRWHRADPLDINSAWIPGKYPANRFNVGTGHSDYSLNGQGNSSFWLHNVKYLRARTIEFGYSLPASVLAKVKVRKLRVYANAYNLFSIDNMKQYNLDPEISDDNGLQFPQSKIVNFGLNLTF
ncbi:TonB-linked outer membrane protein, SusC/RagA family [Pedobacter westerhofensis]|uniref:TonB-linked outer membrane protein, SusC/RagA family n=1 Tax=Pedobacter westerhofensis TaxID=425512 RepID=A0A521CXQ8_9SPHI|nr:TonB-dependent receptor [Pedobacter westerhofensis]SMO64204.1 TonB-linked outer membrane protein, SusC/RagA family [Pedobacter westerhofensis]